MDELHPHFAAAPAVIFAEQQDEAGQAAEREPAYSEAG